ncbi:hypothetical protein DXG01_010616, partial [Tephrocybe rancida]
SDRSPVDSKRKRGGSVKSSWDQEIQKAEVDCLQDYKAMDIMKTHNVKRPVAMDSSEGMIAKGRDANEDWMRLALMIEEQQQVIFIAGIMGRIDIATGSTFKTKPVGLPDIPKRRIKK